MKIVKTKGFFCKQIYIQDENVLISVQIFFYFNKKKVKDNNQREP